ncbi:MAG: hypothetical protein AB7K64_12465 [Variibacter sp.]
MTSVTVQQYSLATSRLFAQRGDVKMPATGFLLRRDDKFFFVTALHVLTGRHWQTKRLLSDTGFIPEEFVLKLPFIKTGNGQVCITWDDFRIAPTYENEEVAPWLVHSKYKDDVDVGIFTLEDIPLRLLEMAKAAGKADLDSGIHAFEWNESTALTTAVADEAFVIGFPENINLGSELPIWKRANIASEPDLLVKGLPYVLIDTGTRQGMSGAPVVRRDASGVVAHPSGNISLATQPRTELYGVYSARLGADELTSQLGIVWPRRVIDEILKSPSLGKSSLCTRLW